MNRLRFLVLGMVVGGGIVGCQSVTPPNWLHPGTADFQQSQAQQFDPYPENEPGPKIVGARPLQYDKPPAEVRRVQPPKDPLSASWLPWNWLQ